MNSRVGETFWFPRMYQKIDEFTINCDSCEMIKRPQKNVRLEFIQMELPR